MLDREEAKKEEDFNLSNDYDDDEEEEWEADADWNNDQEEAEDVKDESAAYLEFLNEEAQKFTAISDEDDDELEEESLLETPLDKVEPYLMFKDSLFSKSSMMNAASELLRLTKHSVTTATAAAVREPDKEPQPGRATGHHQCDPPSRPHCASASAIRAAASQRSHAGWRAPSSLI